MDISLSDQSATPGQEPPGHWVFDEVQTVLTGAGISMAWPTSAPSGDDLAVVAVGRLLESLAGEADADVLLEVARRQKRSPLRLEAVMQRWADHSDSRALFEIYRDELGGLPPNDLHNALVALQDVDLLTLNMDLCVEAAAIEGRASVVHLHGTYDDLESIKTTIGAYEEGLPDELRRAVDHAYRDKIVMVIGYSGRDNDVLPLFLDYPPKKIIWFHFNPNEPISAEASTFFDEARRRGLTCEVKTGDALPYLLAIKKAKPSKVTAAYARYSTAARTSRELAAVPARTRARVLALCLADMGLWTEAENILTPLIVDAGAGDVEFRKLVGRFRRQSDRPRQALSAFGWPPRSPEEVRTLLACTNEAVLAGMQLNSPSALLLNTLIAAVPNRVTRSPSVRNLVQASRMRFAHHLAMRGHSAISERLSLRWRTRDDLATFGVRAEETVWIADVMKAQGRYREALEAVESEAHRSPYLGTYQQANFRWRHGELLALVGRHEEALVHAEWLEETAESTGSPELRAWHLSTFLPLATRSDGVLLDSMLGRLPRRQEVRPATRVYMDLALAEIDLSRGDLAGATQRLDDAEAVLASLSGFWRLPTYAATCTMQRSRVAGQREDFDSARTLARRAGRIFGRYNMLSMKFRCEVLQAGWVQEQVDAREVAVARRLEWSAEIDLMEKKHSKPLPLVL